MSDSSLVQQPRFSFLGFKAGKFPKLNLSASLYKAIVPALSIDKASSWPFNDAKLVPLGTRREICTPACYDIRHPHL